MTISVNGAVEAWRGGSVGGVGFYGVAVTPLSPRRLQEDTAADAMLDSADVDPEVTVKGWSS